MSQTRIKAKRSNSQGRCGWRVVWPLWAFGVMLFLITALCLFQAYRLYGPHKDDVRTVYLKPEGELRLPLAQLHPMQLHLYSVKNGRQDVRFLVERTRDQIVHVTLATCSACARQRKLNYARAGKMICERCNGAMPFAPKGQKVTKHTCFLVEIPHKEVRGELIVSIHDVIERSRHA